MPNINPELSKKRGENVKQLLSECNMKQKELADKLVYHPAYLNAVLNGKRNLTVDMAREIAKLFPPVRYQWILGEDEYRTQTDLDKHYIKESSGLSSACMTLMEYGIREACLAMNIEQSAIDNIGDNIGEFLLVEAQIKDFVVSLMWNYLMYKTQGVGHLWGIMNQLEEILSKKQSAESEGGNG